MRQRRLERQRERCATVSPTNDETRFSRGELRHFFQIAFGGGLQHRPDIITMAMSRSAELIGLKFFGLFYWIALHLPCFADLRRRDVFDSCCRESNKSTVRFGAIRR